jgi:hypothetical protein
LTTHLELQALIDQALTDMEGYAKTADAMVLLGVAATAFQEGAIHGEMMDDEELWPKAVEIVKQTIDGMQAFLPKA